MKKKYIIEFLIGKRKTYLLQKIYIKMDEDILRKLKTQINEILEKNHSKNYCT